MQSENKTNKTNKTKQKRGREKSLTLRAAQNCKNGDKIFFSVYNLIENKFKLKYQ